MTEAAVEQNVKSLIQYYEQHSKSVYDSIKNAGGANDSQIDDLQDETKVVIPNDLKIVFKISNGKLQLHDNFITLSIDQIIQINEVNAVSPFWKKEYLTVAQDSDDNYLLVLCPHDGQSGNVVSWNNDSGVTEELNDNFTQYLQGIIDGLQNGELEYIEGKGLIEKAN